MDSILVTLKDDMKKRFGQIKPIDLTVHIDPRTNHLYRQVIKCYIGGAFEASCVLCRAIAEVIAKRFIEYKGYGNLLVGKNKQSKSMSVQEVLKEKLSIPIEVISKYSKIANKADRILHKRDEKTEEKETLEAIQLLQKFIEQFPKTL